jgi:ribosomal protein S18 acetylase RimI-like enzyme
MNSHAEAALSRPSVSRFCFWRSETDVFYGSRLVFVSARFEVNYADRMEVRRSKPDDADAIAAVHVRSWEAAYRGLVPERWFAERTLQRRTTMWRELLREAEHTRVFVACLEGTIVGFCGAVTPSRDDDAGERTAEIAALYVDPDHWSAGAGHALVTTTLVNLAGGLWREVTLWVFEANDRGRGFYVGLGFEPDGGRVERSDEPSALRLRRQLPVD